MSVARSRLAERPAVDVEGLERAARAATPPDEAHDPRGKLRRRLELQSILPCRRRVRRGATTALTRFTMLLLAVASALALVLGAVGIYGVMAYGVSLRQREIGVRLALGARPRDVSTMISRQGVVLASVGVAAGLAGAFGVTRSLRGLLFDVSPTDPLTLAGTSLVLLVVALFASWIPARRAAAVDPAVALRSD